MKKAILFAAIAILTGAAVFAQTATHEFGVYSQEELSLKECSFDSDAEAIVLFEEGKSYFDDDYRLITDHRIRIKILKQRGIDRGNIKISFYAKDDFEYIDKIRAVAYNPGENPAASALDRKSIYKERQDDRISNIKFAIPNVKVGTIIEYSYTSYKKHYGGLRDWVFQWYIPVIRSSYILQPPPNTEFTYVVFKQNKYPVDIKQIGEGQTYFEMNNLPGLRDEPYMDALQDYLQRVNFQLYSYATAFGGKQKTNTTWEELAASMAGYEYLGGALKKSLPVDPALALAVMTETTAAGRVKAIYSYVKENYTWNGYYGKYATLGLKKVMESKTGNTAEINLVLIGLLRAFDIDAKPLIAAERDYGKVNPEIPLEDGFNITVAFVQAGGKTFILDATRKNCPADIIPYNLLNTYALLAEKKVSNLVFIKSGAGFQNTVKIQGVLEKSGLQKSSAIINSYKYAKEDVLNRIGRSKEKFVTTMYEEKYDGLKVDSFGYQDPRHDSLPVVQYIKFTSQASDAEGYVLFNYNVFTGLQKNLFTASERFTNVNFGYPVQNIIEQEIMLPAGSKTDELPANKTLVMPGGKISVSREVKRTGDSLHVTIVFNQSVTLVTPENYTVLRDFYKSLVDMLNEPIVIKF
jgi:hypothetical protein